VQHVLQREANRRNIKALVPQNDGGVLRLFSLLQFFRPLWQSLLELKLLKVL
jgi:hypothetical protein